MLTMDGQVVKVARTPVVVVPVVVPSPPATVGRNVKIWPSVVTVSAVDKPTGTGTVNPLQIKLPAGEVTSTSPGKVSVDTSVCVGFGGNVGKNVKVSPSIVTIAVALKPVGTGTVNPLQNKLPEEDVTVTPSGKVSVNTSDIGSA